MAAVDVVGFLHMLARHAESYLQRQTESGLSPKSEPIGSFLKLPPWKYSSPVLWGDNNGKLETVAAMVPVIILDTILFALRPDLQKMSDYPRAESMPSNVPKEILAVSRRHSHLLGHAHV